jgi:outer membrane receptor protein involved in Fe transport
MLFLDPSGIGGTNNGGTARSQGVEWTATLTPADGLTAVWTGAYTEAELTEDAPALFATEGAALPNVPGWASTLNVDYEWNAFGGATAYVGGVVRYVGERSSNFGMINFLLLGDPQVELPSYTHVDLRAGVDFERFGVQLFAKNVGNDDSPLTFSNFTQVAPNALNGAANVPRPRTIGVELTARF